MSQITNYNLTLSNESSLSSPDLQAIISTVTNANHQCYLLAKGFCNQCNSYLAKRNGTYSIITQDNVPFDYQNELLHSRRIADLKFATHYAAMHDNLDEMTNYLIITPSMPQPPQPTCSLQHLDNHTCPPQVQCSLDHVADHMCASPTPCTRNHLSDHTCPLPTEPVPSNVPFTNEEIQRITDAIISNLPLVNVTYEDLDFEPSGLQSRINDITDRLRTEIPYRIKNAIREHVHSAPPPAIPERSTPSPATVATNLASFAPFLRDLPAMQSFPTTQADDNHHTGTFRVPSSSTTDDHRITPPPGLTTYFTYNDTPSQSRQPTPVTVPAPLPQRPTLIRIATVAHPPRTPSPVLSYTFGITSPRPIPSARPAVLDFTPAFADPEPSSSTLQRQPSTESFHRTESDSDFMSTIPLRNAFDPIPPHVPTSQCHHCVTKTQNRARLNPQHRERLNSQDERRLHTHRDLFYFSE